MNCLNGPIELPISSDRPFDLMFTCKYLLFEGHDRQENQKKMNFVRTDYGNIYI